MEAPATGGRRHRKHSAKKLRLVKVKTARRILAKKGLKMRGGAEPATVAEAMGGGPGAALSPASTGGRRRRHGKTHRRSRRGGLFGKMGF